MKGNASRKIVGALTLLLVLGFLGYSVNRFISDQSEHRESQTSMGSDESAKQQVQKSTEAGAQSNIASPESTGTIWGSREHVLTSFKSCEENDVRPMMECLRKHYEFDDVNEDEIAFLILLDPEIESDVEVQSYLVEQDEDKHEHLDTTVSEHSLVYMSGSDFYFSKLKNDEFIVCLEIDDGNKVGAETYSYFSQDPSGTRYLESVVAWSAAFSTINVTEIDKDYYALSIGNDPKRCEEL